MTIEQGISVFETRCCDTCDGRGHNVQPILVYEMGCAWPRYDTYEELCLYCMGLGYTVHELDLIEVFL